MALSAPVDSLPFDAFAPDQSPDAPHEVALVEDHVSVDDSPLEILVGLAAKTSVGSGRTVTVTLWLVVPPGPVHASE